MIQGCQFCSITFKMIGISRFNLKNGTNWNKFHLAQNLLAHSINSAKILAGMFRFHSNQIMFFFSKKILSSFTISIISFNSIGGSD